MDFAFSEEQEMLRGQAREFLSDRFGGDRVAELAGSDEGWDRTSWKQIAELGWIGLSAPESAGGAGMGFLDEAVVLEELGYALYPGPYFSTVALALPGLQRDPGLLERVAAGEATATLAWSESGAPALIAAGSTVTTEVSGGKLSGTKIRVPDAAAADIIVVAAQEGGEVGLWAVEAADAQVSPTSTMDSTRRYGDVVFDGAPATALVPPGEGAEVLSHIRLRALAAASLEAVGVGQRALDLAREYVKERQQFEKPIGIYQAVSHQVADTYMAVELARSISYWAAWCVAESDEQAERAVAAAKVQAADAAVFACERSIQVHGGIGFTWEHILHRYYKRAQWLQAFQGSASQHLEALAGTLFVA